MKINNDAKAEKEASTKNPKKKNPEKNEQQQQPTNKMYVRNVTYSCALV